MENLHLLIIKFLKEEEEKFSSLEELLNKENFFEEKQKIVRFINKVLNENKLDKWQIRELVANVYKYSGVNLETDNVKKVLFLLLTDAINERIPSPSPLYFPYNDRKVPKRHAIITDFDLYTFLKETVSNINDEKKHIILFNLWSDGSLIKEGVSYYLSVLDYYLFLFLDRALYEEILPLDEILVEKINFLEINKNNLSFLLNILFSALFEFYTGKKETLSILNKDKTRYLIKAKKFINEILKDKKEEEYLKEIAKDDEYLSENKKEYIKDEKVQKQILEEAKKKDAPEVDKIDAILWLLGIENINPKVFFEYFSLKDFNQFLPQLIEDVKDEKEKLFDGLNEFFRKLFNLPYLFNGDVENIEKIISNNLSSLKADFLFWKRNYEDFLISKISSDINSQLKKVFAEFKTNKIDEKEFKNWLSFFESKEEVDKDLLKFIKNG